MQIGYEDSKHAHLWHGDHSVNSAGINWGDTLMIVRQANAGEQAPRIERFAFAIEKWDQEVEAELRRRKLIQPEANVKGSLGINCVDVNGFKTQACDKLLVLNSSR